MTVKGTASCAENCLIYQTWGSVLLKAHVESHMKSKQHNQIMKHKQNPFTQSITDFFGGTNKSAPTTKKSDKQVSSFMAISEQTSDVLTVPVSSTSTFLIISEDVLHVEVLLVIKAITSYYSFSSCKDISCLFPKMFPDNQIAQSFLCGATKCAYLACFGIYHFHELLIEKIRAIKYYTLSFDESLNQINRKKEMDMIDSGQQKQ